MYLDFDSEDIFPESFYDSEEDALYHTLRQEKDAPFWQKMKEQRNIEKFIKGLKEHPMAKEIIGYKSHNALLNIIYKGNNVFVSDFISLTRDLYSQVSPIIDLMKGVLCDVKEELLEVDSYKFE